jgi:NitT/TauT family transport system substrate-binding protein
MKTASRVLRSVVALAALALLSGPALADEQVRIGIGYGLAFLPVYICQDLKLVEKYAKARHLRLQAHYERFSGAAAVQDAIASAAIDMGPFGLAPLLTAWDKAKGAKDSPRDSRGQILAVSGITTMPVVLLTNQPKVRSIADLRASDRIAMPTLSSPQMYVLQMQAEKNLGQYDRLNSQVVELSPSDAVVALIDGSGPVTAYFASPPFTEIALKDEKVHQILSSVEVIGGKASFLILGARRGYVEAHPQIPQVVDEAMDEAARLIHDDPQRAARIYLTHEPSKALDAGAIGSVLKDNADAFGSPIEGIQAFANFMGRHGELKTPPQSWKDIVAPALLTSPSG